MEIFSPYSTTAGEDMFSTRISTFQPMSAILQSHVNLPSLPRELERDILELTARLYPESRTRLTIVARRTQIW